MENAKSVIEVIQDFFNSHGLNVTTINVKLNYKGRIEYATGEYGPMQLNGNCKPIVKAYNKKLVAKDARFSNTELTLTSKQFILLDRTVKVVPHVNELFHHE